MLCPTTQQSLVVYQQVCRCDCRYVGRTSLRLQERITQRIPKSIRNKEKPTKVLSRRNCKAKTPLNQLECDSAIGLHLLQNPDCAAQYHERQFSILAKAKTQFYIFNFVEWPIRLRSPHCKAARLAGLRWYLNCQTSVSLLGDVRVTSAWDFWRAFY